MAAVTVRETYVYETNDKKNSKNKQLPIITSKINLNQIYILSFSSL